MFRRFLSIAALSVLALNYTPDAAAQTKAPARAAATSAVTGPVNINTASAGELEALPGIGAKTAALIVEYRQKNGPFKKIEDILETSRSCPYSLSISCLSAHRSVAGNR